MKKTTIILAASLFIALLLSSCSPASLKTVINPDTTQQTAVGTSGQETTDNGIANTNIKTVTMNLYFPNADNSAVMIERRGIKVRDGALIRSAAEALIAGPVSDDLRKPFPEGTQLIDVNKKGDVAIVNFTKEYTQSAGIAEIVERVSLVNTLTGITGVNKVRVLVEGKPLVGPSGIAFGDLEKFKLDDQGKPVPGEVKTLTLYFGNFNADKVVPEMREVCVDEGESLEEVIFDELSSGPRTEGLYPVVPVGTKLLSAETRNGICYLNLSREFVDNNKTGSAGEAMTVNSIVNSLTELPTVKSVQFLIEGSKREAYIHLVFDEPIPRNEAMIGKQP